MGSAITVAGRTMCIGDAPYSRRYSEAFVDKNAVGRPGVLLCQTRLVRCSVIVYPSHQPK